MPALTFRISTTTVPPSQSLPYLTKRNPTFKSQPKILLLEKERRKIMSIRLWSRHLSRKHPTWLGWRGTTHRWWWWWPAKRDWDNHSTSESSPCSLHSIKHLGRWVWQLATNHLFPAGIHEKEKIIFFFHIFIQKKNLLRQVCVSVEWQQTVKARLRIVSLKFNDF